MNGTLRSALGWGVAIATTLLVMLTTANFARASAAHEEALEAEFDASVKSADQIAWMREIASAPHNVGSAHDRENAQHLRNLFDSWGWSAKIETFYILYPTPVLTTVEIVTPKHVALGGMETPLPIDPGTADLSKAIPPYLAYQGDGDVTAPVVYANYGTEDDFAELTQHRVDVRGKIVLVRYGVVWRGLKAKLAQEHGALGCIMYWDPAQDGYGQGDVYPKGGYFPGNAVQRGSVADDYSFVGDPLTPGVGATKDAKRLPRAESPMILKIPAMAISYNDAAQLLRRMGGGAVPTAWHGGLPFAYHFGDGAVTVHLAVKSNWRITPIYDVIARIDGAKYPNEWIVRGNHRDAWVQGAQDPTTGTVAMLSEAKALGVLLRKGWRPSRTIIYASWDAEEPGMMGSAEWAEEHSSALKANGLVYINSDSIGRGFLRVRGAPQWQMLIDGVAKRIKDPESGTSVETRWRSKMLADAYLHGADVSQIQAIEDKGLVQGPLGSGGDFAAFQQHLGLATLDVEYDGEDNATTYHSAYDTVDHALRFIDPGLIYGAVLSRTIGHIVLRMADLDELEVAFAPLAKSLSEQLVSLKALASHQRMRDLEFVRLEQEGAFNLGADPTTPVRQPAPSNVTPKMDFAPLDRALQRLSAAAAQFDATYLSQRKALSTRNGLELDATLHAIDQLMLDEHGLPGRPWYKNLVYGPDIGGTDVFPGIRDPLVDRRFSEIAPMMARTVIVVDAFTARIRRAERFLTSKNLR
jgi:N-acetylated-alpha-linked acidic dipeptidase